MKELTSSILAIACMKDEGPFILEWVAYHRSIGVSDFLIVSNDCSDGTELILDRLDEMGWVRHVPNPSMAGLTDVPIQHAAIAYAHLTKEFRKADWILIMDADEYLNINVGAGRLDDLFAEVGDIDAMSFSQVVFGSSGAIDFLDQPTLPQFKHRFDFNRPFSEMFPRMYGIKTLARNDTALFRRHANHRPVLFPPARAKLRWLDGSGIAMSEHFRAKLPRGYRTPTGTHALGYINHYAVRSVQSFMVQSVRGDAVDAAVRRDIRYWRQYDRNEIEDTTILNKADRARILQDELLQDDELRMLHLRAVDIHRKKFEAGLKSGAMRDLYESILASA